MRVDEQTDSFVGDILEHHGVKGMKWGVRRNLQERRTRLADKGFETKTTSFGKWVEVHNAAADHFNSHIGAINDKHDKLGHDFSKEPFEYPDHWSPAYKQYNKEVADLSRQSLEHAVSQMPTNRSGTRKVKLNYDENNPGQWHLTTEAIQHAATIDVIVTPTRNTSGRIVSVEFQTNDMAQGFLAIGQILEHHGVKGMKWGVRKERSSSVNVERAGRKGKKLKTSGGHDLPVHPDAKRAATTKQVKKASGTVALSNKDLADYAKRLELEQRVKRLEFESSSPSKKFIKKLLGQQGNQAASQVASQATAKAVKKSLAKTALAAA